MVSAIANRTALASATRRIGRDNVAAELIADILVSRDMRITESDKSYGELKQCGAAALDKPS